MAIVGTAFVRVSVISDRLGDDIEKTVRKAVKDSGLDKVGADVGKSVGESISKGVGESKGMKNVADSIGDQIDNPKNRKKLSTRVGGMFKTVFGKLKAFQNSTFRKETDKLVDGILSSFSRLAGAGLSITKFIGIMGAVPMAIGPLVGALGGLVGVVGQLAGGLAFLPALGLAGAATLGTLMLGLKDLDKAGGEAGAVVSVIKGFGDAWSELQKSVQEQLFMTLAEPIKALGEKYLPVLKDGLSGIASGLNDIAREAIGFLSDPTVVQATADGLERTHEMLTNIAKGVKPWLQGFTQIASVGSKFLPRFGKWIADIGQRFADFIAKAGDEGITRWIENAITAAKKLWDILGNVLGVFKGLFQAAGVGGAVFLTSLQTITQSLETLVNNPLVQQGLTKFFAAGSDALGSLMTSLGTTLPGIIAAIAPVFESAAGQISGILSTAIEGIQPIIERLSPIVQDLVDAVGPMIQGVIETASTVIQEDIMPVIEDLAPAIEDFIDAVGPAAQTIIESFGKVFKKIGEDYLPPVIEALTGIADWISDNQGAIEVMVGLFIGWKLAMLGLAAAMRIWAIASGIATAAMWLFNFAVLDNPIVAVIALIIGAILLLIKNWDKVTQVLSDGWNKIKEIASLVGGFFVNLWNTVTTWITNLFDTIGTWIQNIWDELYTWATNLPGQIAGWVAGWTESFVTWAVDLIKKFGDWVQDIWDEFYDWATGLPGDIARWVAGWTTEFYNWAIGLIEDFGNWLQDLWDEFYDWATGLPGDIAGWLAGWWTEFEGWFTGLASDVGTWLAGVWTKISDWFTGLLDDFLGWGGEIVDKIVEGITGAAWKVAEAIAGLLPEPQLNPEGTGFVTVGGSDLTPMRRQIAEMVHKVVAGPGLYRAAEGGTFAPMTGGVPILVAEAGRPERVEPLDKQGLSQRDRALINHLAGMNTQGSNVSVQVWLGDREITDLVDSRITQSNRQLTRSLMAGRRIATA